LDRYNINNILIGARIKRAREKKGYTQSRLAELVNIYTNMIGKLEINCANPSLKTILAIANVLEVDINFFVSDK